MSTFQISLAVVGGIVLGLIVAYNAWTHRRNEPKRPHSDMHADELEARFDPALDSASASTERNVAGSSHSMLADGLLNVAPGAERQDAAAYEAAADSAVQEALSARTLQAVADKKHALDGLIDAIASIKLEHAITGDAALLVQPTTRRAGSKPFRIEGLNEACGEWESVRSGQRYIAFQAGVQLANRLGALNEIEFSEFVSKVQSFADALNAAVDLPDMLQEVGRARELDQFASEHDAQLSFMLRPRRAAWSPGYIKQNATEAGFVASAMPGRMVLPSETVGNAPVLSLSYDPQAAQADNLDQTAVHEVWLSLDVPQVSRTEEPFQRLRLVIKHLCENMDGMLCDQTGYQLLPQVLDPIDADLQKLYDQLDSRELSAGSVLARRLFN